MPTGYTAAIADGITFEQYALGCARNFGALIMMRDEPSDAAIPERFEPSDYNSKALEEAKKRHATLQQMTAEELEAAANAAYSKELASFEQRLQKKRDQRAKYEAMLVKVRAFKAPSPEHVEYCCFMESQIVESIKFDCSEDYMERPRKLSPDAWLIHEMTAAIRSIGYHEEEHRKEVERAGGRNRWVSQLRAALSENE